VSAEATATSGLTGALARLIVSSTLASVPAAAVGKSKKVLADTFATIVAGAGSEVAPPLLKYIERSGAEGASPILATDRRTTPELAALVNGSFGHALDFDDVLPMMPGHPSAIIVAAALARPALRRLTGAALIEAHIIGIEIGAKIGVAITHGHYERGFHGTGTLGIFSALGALAKLDALDENAIRTAFGLAASMASGVRRNFGTMAKPLHTGWAARNALTAVDLAGCGLTAASDVLEGRSGFFAAYGVDGSNPARAVEALGNPWAIVEPGIGLKQYPCYNGVQRAMYGLLELRERLALTADTLERIECCMAPGATKVMTYPRPATGLEGKFSMHYALAAGVLDGKYGLATFTDHAVNRPQIRALLDRIELREEARCGADDPLSHTRAAGTRGFVELEVRTRNGRIERMRIDTIPGHPTKELGWDAIEAKFMDCARYGGLAEARAAQAYTSLRTLETCENVSEIVELLVLPQDDRRSALRPSL
jgi:2-methylcitrate dehydratase PrpD